ncbi:MBL fold metallo-hydrolase [Fontimonas sp. SYSU GA230001]|uniref:MBL fold metallo-hydrolase n=1 Tax=Fontimonas sp. SYSU GA230001 TaxID=3142450 RepID=UPI0032B49E51
MSRTVWITTAAIGLGLAALAWSFTPQSLSVAVEGMPEVMPMTRPQPPADMRVGVFQTGHMDSKALFAYRGGGFDDRVFGMDVVVVDHPQGVLLFDAGFGRKVEEHAKTVPWLMRVTSKITPEVPVIDQLSGASLSPERLRGVVLTHAHWDHVSGLDDLRGVPVWVTQRELDFIHSGHPAARLAAQLGELHYEVYDFGGGPYWGFAKSHDVFGDGSVVLVPAGGHTPGSIIAFIHAPDGHSYALIGDLAWQHEGIDIPAERPWMSRLLVDDDAAGVRAALLRLHLLQRAMPDLIIVPAHDRRVTRTLPPATRADALKKG